jgi:type IV pilus assembly protein PilB
MIQDEDIRLGRALSGRGYIDKIKFDKFQRVMKETESHSPVEVLVDTLGISEDVVAEVLSQEFKIPHVELLPEIINVPPNLIPDSILRKHLCLPVLISGVELTVAFVDPPYKSFVDELRNAVKMFIVPVAVTLSSFNALTKRKGHLSEEVIDLPSKLNIELFEVQRGGRERYAELQRNGKLPNAEVVFEEIIIRAVRSGVNDIHLEPGEKELRVRFNTDGVMENLVSLPKEFSEGVVNIVKARSNMDLFEKKKPQEGRYTSAFSGQTFDFRISTVPTIEGDRIAIRVLKKSSGVLNIHELGFSQENLAKIQHLLQHPRGLVVVTGPSASGKSATLYAGIAELRAQQRNIFTIENPVEYRLEFASQVQIDLEQKLDFANSLRAIMRQSPDVILLGEIRDAEAGVAAVEAALTGKLVLSTMLSNNAISTISRLISLGIPPYSLAPTLSGVVYQQLVRTVCRYCKEKYTPLRRTLLSAGLGQLDGSISLYRGKGCEHCGGDGYLGRTAIHEVFVVDEEIRDLIFQQASPIKLKEAAKAKGFEDIYLDAAKKLVTGVISLEEYLRVLG